MAKHSTLGVVLVNYRSFDDIAERVRSCALADARVVVVDNASDPDRVGALCAETGSTAVLLPTNQGFAAGVAAGFAQLNGIDELLLLNPDAALRRADLYELRRLLNDWRVDGVAPLLVEPSGRVQVGVGGGRLSVKSFAIYFLGLAHLFPALRGIFLTRHQARNACEVDWLCAACLLIRANAFTKYGPFPIDELVYGEDVAWGTAATAAGARLQLVPYVRVTHRVGASGGSQRWSGALERLAMRRLGRVRGVLAVICLRVGIGLRRFVGRTVR